MYYIRRELEEEICLFFVRGLVHQPKFLIGKWKKFVFVKSAVSIVLNLFCNVNDDTSTLSSKWLSYFKRETKYWKILI